MRSAIGLVSPNSACLRLTHSREHVLRVSLSHLHVRVRLGPARQLIMLRLRWLGHVRVRSKKRGERAFFVFELVEDLV